MSSSIRNPDKRGIWDLDVACREPVLTIHVFVLEGEKEDDFRKHE